MTFDQFGKLFPSLQTAATDPQAARATWHVLLELLPADERFERMLEAVALSAMIDLITDRIATDDAYAQVIAGRIHTLLDRVAPVPTGPATPASAA